MANLEIRKAATDKNIYLWEVAEQLGCTDFTLSRKLRRELKPDDRAKVLAAVDAAAAEKQAHNG